jgi:hypothetical protein
MCSRSAGFGVNRPLCLGFFLAAIWRVIPVEDFTCWLQSGAD